MSVPVENCSICSVCTETMAINSEGVDNISDPQTDAIWILSSTFIIFTMQSGNSNLNSNLLIELLNHLFPLFFSSFLLCVSSRPFLLYYGIHENIDIPIWKKSPEEGPKLLYITLNRELFLFLYFFSA